MRMNCKRFLSLLLAIGMVLCLMPAKSVSAATFSGGTILYLKPNSNWTQSNAWFAAYFFNNSTGKNAWVAMTDTNYDGIFEVTAPSGTWANVIFCRMSSASSTLDWSNKWNQTADLTYNGTNNLYIINDGSWDAGKWLTYSQTYTVVGVDTLCGTKWDTTNTANDMVKNGTTGLYEKVFTNVAAGSYSFKVVVSHSWDYASWPNADKAFTVTYTTANVTITFNESTKAINVIQTCAHGGTTTTTDTATCGQAGTKTVTCNECGGTISETSSPATGNHSFSDGTCSSCGLGCNHQWDNGTCSVCHLVCAHNYVEGTCSVCHFVCAHNYVEGTCTICGSEDPNYVAHGAQIGNTTYATLDDALANANTDDTIQLTKDAALESLMLMDGISLDLNGCTLTVGYVAAYPGSAITDTTGGGLLKAAKNRVMLQKDNGYLPIWDGEGYIFRNCTTLHENLKAETEDSVVYQFLPVIGTQSYALLAQGTENSGVTMKVVVSWDRGNGTTSSVTFTYSDSLLEAFYASYDPEAGTFAQAFELTLSGIAGKELSYKVYFESETGVLLECPTAAN